jgi:hypothetical protein
MTSSLVKNNLNITQLLIGLHPSVSHQSYVYGLYDSFAIDSAAAAINNLADVAKEFPEEF